MDATAAICVNLCKAAYDDSDPRFVTVDELRFGVIPVGDATYLVFRGTDNAQGWARDLTVIPAITRSGYIAHKGFIDAAEKLLKEIDKRLPRTGNVVITGHSLGGALAVLYGEECPGDEVVTFGCPRVYSRLNETYPNMPHTRYVNHGDPIPSVPNPLTWHHLCDPVMLGEGHMLDRDQHSIDLYLANLT